MTFRSAFLLLLALMLLPPALSSAAVNALDFEDLRIPLTGRPADGSAAGAGIPREWVVSPSQPGIGGVPPPSLIFDAPDSIKHDPANILEIDIATSASVAFVLTGTLRRGKTEVFTARQVSNDSATLRWMLSQRVGRADDLTSFSLAAQYIPGAPFPAEPVLVAEPRIIDASLLSDPELIAASPFRALVPNYLMPATPTTTIQEVQIVLPGLVAVRNQGKKVGLLLDGHVAADFQITLDQAADADLYVRTISLPAYGHSGDERQLQLLLQKADQKFYVLEQRQINILPAERDYGQFEQPFRSIRDYEITGADGDMLVVALLDDLYSDPEPLLAATATHEIVGNFLSPYTGKFESNPVWRIQAFDHWAEAGFRSVGMGRHESVVAMFVSGADAAGVESIGLAASSGSGVLRPLPTNPIIVPTGAFSGREDGLSLALRGNAAVPYGEGFALLTWSQAGNREPRMLAYVCPDLRYWVEAGVVPTGLPRDTRHVAVEKRGDLYYMTTDESDRLWVSSDPLRHWQPFDVEFPTDWRAFRLKELNGTEYLFGLYDFEGRSVLRWQEVTWNADRGIPLPEFATTPSPAQGAGPTARSPYAR